MDQIHCREIDSNVDKAPSLVSGDNRVHGTTDKLELLCETINRLLLIFSFAAMTAFTIVVHAIILIQ